MSYMMHFTVKFSDKSLVYTMITGFTRRRHSVTDQINRFHNIKLSEDKPKTQTKTSPQRSLKSQISPIVFIRFTKVVIKY